MSDESLSTRARARVATIVGLLEHVTDILDLRTDDENRREQIILAHWRIAVVSAELGQSSRDREHFVASDRHFDDTLAALRDAQLYDYQPLVQWSRAVRFLRESAVVDEPLAQQQSKHALDLAVSSYVAAHHQRFQVADPDLCAWWDAYADQRLAWTLSLAHGLGDHVVVAELVEYGINAGVHSIVDQTNPVGDDVPAQLYHPRRIAPGVASSADVDHRTAELGTGARLLNSSRLALQPPPALSYPTEAPGGERRVVLGRHRQMAVDLDPDLRSLLDAVPDVDAW